MLQKEVAQRICAPPGSKEYGSISAAVGYFAQPKMLFTVSPACFYPKPDVHSAVMSLSVQPCDRNKADKHLKTVKAIFAMRRKTVNSNLRQGYNMTSEYGSGWGMLVLLSISVLCAWAVEKKRMREESESNVTPLEINDDDYFIYIDDGE